MKASIGLMGRKKGALPSQTIKTMFEAGLITGAVEENVRPSSLDLTLSEEVYRVKGIFQPRPGETIRAMLKQVEKKKVSWDEPLDRDQVYLARLNEKFFLPETVYAFCNPKSTSGRLDIHVRLLADGVPRYDSLTPAGWRGEMWVSIVPKTFPVKMYSGLSLNQIRFFNSDSRLNELELEIAVEQYKLLWDIKKRKPLSYRDLKVKDGDGSLILTLDLAGSVIGYRAINGVAPLDLAMIGHYEAKKYFEPIKKNGSLFYLKKGQFYILSTYEAVRVPPELACEMVPMDEKSGEFRSHYAGFIDPGWGWGQKGEGKGRPLTLEVRPFEDLVVRHGQPIGKIKFEIMAERPDVVYDSLNSNYLKQSGPRLAKQFK